MQELFDIDLSEPSLLASRTGRWLRVRIQALINTNSRLHYALFPPSEEEVDED